MLAKGSFFSRAVNKYWVSTQFVPTKVIDELQLDLSRPIIYIVEKNSASDLLGLQASCLQAGLPDPFQAIDVNGQTISATIYLQSWSLFSSKLPQMQDATYLDQYQQLLDLHRDDETLDIQVVPVSFAWGRNPGKEGKTSWFDLREQGSVGAIQKSIIVLKNAKDHMVRFNQPLSIARLVKRGGNKNALAFKLARLALYYFGSQKRSSIGPKLPDRNEMIKSIVKQERLQRVIVDIAQKEGKTLQQVESQSQHYLKEISADFSYPFLRVFKYILSFVWNTIYKGVEVNNAEPVRQATQSGAEIIYMPCHRSHADYLLMSYILFEQGLVPPHIAAGVNLNFFPAGSIFRRSGAFFLRRTFKGNPLYSEVFKAYFSMLFKKGYPIEFFTEGGRSRTGRLLPPKVGLISMSLQTYLAQPERNVIIVPVYIGYDHIMEVSTYTKEMAGQKKEKESAWQVLGIIRKLGNFGRVFVNFGEPINVKKHFDSNIPDWKGRELTKPEFKKQLNTIAKDVMIGINNAAAVNALPFCALILLSDTTGQMDKAHLFENIKKHQQLLSLLSENSLLTYSKESTLSIYEEALALNKFTEIGNTVSISRQQATPLTYYRNNILHLFVPNAMICSVVRYLLWKKLPLTVENITQFSREIYPYLQAEYFLDDKLSLDDIVCKSLSQLCVIGVLINRGGVYQSKNVLLMNVLIGHLQETYLRYRVAVNGLLNQCDDWTSFDQKTHLKYCKKELQLSSIEPFDLKVNKVFIESLQRGFPHFLDENNGKQLLDLFYHNEHHYL